MIEPATEMATSVCGHASASREKRAYCRLAQGF